MPTGIAKFSDKPDVIFTSSNGQIIGIEITECIYNQNLKQYSEFMINFNNEVIQHLNDKIAFKFLLDIELDKEYSLRKSQRKSTINKLLEICTKEFSTLAPYESKSIENLDFDLNDLSIEVQESILANGYRNLPKGISTINITRYHDLNKSAHFESNFGVVPEFTDEDLGAILTKKNKALENYTKCDKYWLLIAEGLDFYSYISAVNITSEIQTKFDRIFMYRRFSSEVISLK
ncbi:hypothetical protein [Chryseobacterium sp.]|uniref:hypothetical protein n=1 Tax=Chryseobacterium sp. TaxID=1871047 RepID=UPI0011C8741E|nr:hypothetical protein [Chryseobacterium sp.]TXF75808.1 hypothetical protein FUA25_07850 [Chryseobacterium sp.]